MIHEIRRADENCREKINKQDFDASLATLDKQVKLARKFAGYLSPKEKSRIRRRANNQISRFEDWLHPDVSDLGSKKAGSPMLPHRIELVMSRLNSIVKILATNTLGK